MSFLQYIAESNCSAVMGGKGGTRGGKRNCHGQRLCGGDGDDYVDPTDGCVNLDELMATSPDFLNPLDHKSLDAMMADQHGVDTLAVRMMVHLFRYVAVSFALYAKHVAKEGKSYNLGKFDEDVLWPPVPEAAKRWDAAAFIMGSREEIQKKKAMLACAAQIVDCIDRFYLDHPRILENLSTEEWKNDIRSRERNERFLATTLAYHLLQDHAPRGDYKFSAVLNWIIWSVAVLTIWTEEDWRDKDQQSRATHIEKTIHRILCTEYTGDRAITRLPKWLWTDPKRFFDDRVYDALRGEEADPNDDADTKPLAKSVSTLHLCEARHGVREAANEEESVPLREKTSADPIVLNCGTADDNRRCRLSHLKCTDVL